MSGRYLRRAVLSICNFVVQRLIVFQNRELGESIRIVIRKPEGKQFTWKSSDCESSNNKVDFKLWGMFWGWIYRIFSNLIRTRI